MVADTKKFDGVVVVLIIGVMIFGTLNNFGGKMKANLMGTHNFVTGCVDNWLHTVVSGTIVAILMSRGVVTRPQVAYVFRFSRRWEENGIWKYIAIASVNDVANNITGLASQPYLTTLMMSLMDQATTPFTVICSFLMLGTRYIAVEVVSVIVILGAAIAGVLVVQQDASGDNNTFWALFAAGTTIFAAVSYVLKEKAFRQYRAYTDGAVASSDRATALLQDSAEARAELPKTLNVFLVSLIVSIGGSLTCVPVALISRSVTNDGSPVQALTDGFHALWTIEGALPVYFFATVINYCFNYCLLALTARGSALLAFVSLKIVVPCTALCSVLPWPLIGSKPVPAQQWGILAFMLVALAFFRYGNIEREDRSKQGLHFSCCWPLCGRGEVASTVA